MKISDSASPSEDSEITTVVTRHIKPGRDKDYAGGDLDTKRVKTISSKPIFKVVS